MDRSEHGVTKNFEYKVFRIYTFVMRMSHNLTKSPTKFSKKESKTPRVTLYNRTVCLSYI